MKITFGGFFRITPATIMRCGPTFRLARTRPTHARSSGLETSLRSRSLADYTIDTHESEFSEATVVKAANGHGGYWTKGFAVADDFEDADGTHVLTFHQAGDAGKALARGKADTTDSKPMTVADAIARYKIDLKNRGGHLTNATRVEKHLTSTLAGKPVALLTVRDLQTWRNGLKEKMEPSSVNRTRTGLRAALELEQIP